MGAFLALLLSFFIPGLGQFYNGQLLKGVLLFFGAIILLFIFTILAIPVWLYGMFDAYSVANRPKAESQSPIVTQQVTQKINLENVVKESNEFEDIRVKEEKHENFQEVCPKCEGDVTKTGNRFICQGCGTKFTDMEAAWKYRVSKQPTTTKEKGKPELGKPELQQPPIQKAPSEGKKTLKNCSSCGGKISELNFFKLKAGSDVVCEFCGDIIES